MQKFDGQIFSWTPESFSLCISTIFVFIFIFFCNKKENMGVAFGEVYFTGVGIYTLSKRERGERERWGGNV